MEPLTPANADFEYSIGRPEADKAKARNSGRLYVILNGETLNIRGIKITTSAKKAKIVNFFGKIWTHIKNIFPGQKVIVRRKYVPITIGRGHNAQVIYVNLNSFFKHLAFFRGKKREETLHGLLHDDIDARLIEAIEGDSTLDPIDQGSYVSNFILRYAIYYYNHHRTADARLATVERFFKHTLPQDALTLSYLNIKDYDPLTNPIYRPEKYQRTKEYVALSDERMRLSGTMGGLLEESEQKAAMSNWPEADQLVTRWAMDRSKRSLEINDLLEIHRILGQGLRNNGYPAGVFRRPGEEVSGNGNRDYIAGKDVAAEMNKYMIWLKSQLRECDHNPQLAVKTAAEAYHRFVSIHPFNDANGRTARMVMDYILQRYGLPPAALKTNKAGVFGELPDKDNISMKQMILWVREGVERSCEILHLKSPFDPLREKISE